MIDLERSLSELKRLTLDNARQQQSLATLTPVVRQRLESMRQLFDASNRDVQQTVFAGTALMDRARQLTQAIHQEDSRLLQERTVRARDAEANTRADRRVRRVGWQSCSLHSSVGSSLAAFFGR